jgi:hypothetical protein
LFQKGHRLGQGDMDKRHDPAPLLLLFGGP